MRAAKARAWSRCVATSLTGTFRPISTIACRKSARSSAMRIASGLAPSTSTPWAFSTPDSASCRARLSAVCPPTVGKSASGFSRAMTASRKAGVRGSTYVRSASSGSVMMVAGFELTRTTS
ncbi:MAG: hypothetical protein QM765_10815 [Myxococcales bacterium]